MTVSTPRSGQIYIAGQWHPLRETRTVHSPWDGHTVGEFAWGRRREAEQAIEAAAQAMRTPLPAHRRARVLQEAACILRDRREQLGRIVAEEAGKPIATACAEVDRAEQTLLFSADAARNLHGELIPMDAHPSGEGCIGMALRVPIGIVAAITPFNFPLNLVAHKIGPALAAGCACVLKPADKTPFSALALTQIFADAGLPPGWLNTVTGDPESIAQPFLEDDRVRAISFTGSAAVGWSLRAAAPRKKVLLELGNSTPLIVLAEADLDAAVQAIVAGGYAFSGQACISVQRVCVEEPIAAALTAKLLAEVQRLRVGDPLDPATQVGPLITQASCDRVVAWVREAELAGAKILTGPVQAHRNLLNPILLSGVSASMTVSCRELFGPVVVLQTVSSLQQAVALANATDYGLQAAIFTGNLAAALQVVPQLDFGAVMINESPSFRADHMPYGGIKDSGNTREGPAYAVEEFSQYRTVVLRYRSSLPQPPAAHCDECG